MRQQASMHNLRGKTAVVTGAARGIGASLSLALARAGAEVALVGLEPAELEATAARCAEHSPARAWVADVTDRARMAEVATEVAAHFGHIDIVVANAGIGIGGLFSDADPDAFDRVIEVNLGGSVGTARAFLPALTDAKGYFLQIASLAAMAPAPLMAAYCASKSGVEAFAHVLRTEVAHSGVRVGVAYLTWTDTDLVRAEDDDEYLLALRARLGQAPPRRAPLEPAVARIVAGIARRAGHVYGQPWIAALQWLPRATLPVLLTAPQAKKLGREASKLGVSVSRQIPMGPGGRAAWEAKKEARKTG